MKKIELGLALLISLVIFVLSVLIINTAILSAIWLVITFVVGKAPYEYGKLIIPSPDNEFGIITIRALSVIMSISINASIVYELFEEVSDFVSIELIPAILEKVKKNEST